MGWARRWGWYERPLRIWPSCKEWQRWGCPSMVTEGPQTSQSEVGVLTFYPIRKSRQKHGTRIQVGAGVAASKPWTFLGRVYNVVTPNHIYQMNPPNRLFFFNLPFNISYFCSNCTTVLLKWSSHSLSISPLSDTGLPRPCLTGRLVMSARAVTANARVVVRLALGYSGGKQ